MIPDTKKPRYGIEYIRKLQQPRGRYKDKNIKGRTQGRKHDITLFLFLSEKRKNKAEKKAAIIKNRKFQKSLKAS